MVKLKFRLILIVIVLTIFQLEHVYCKNTNHLNHNDDVVTSSAISEEHTG